MKILIGTPIRDIKEYSIYKWLDNVKELSQFDTLMVDNSDDELFSIRVKEYCGKIGLQNYEIIHIPDLKGKESEYRLVQSREVIRNKLLEGDYDYWLSWECDIILPSNTLEVLVPYMEVFDVANHTYPDKDDPNYEVGGIGCSLFKRYLLEKYSFLEGGGYEKCDPICPNCYYSGDSWLVVRILRGGYKIVDLHGLLNIKHLGNGSKDC
jgi:hypothetical protein